MNEEAPGQGIHWWGQETISLSDLMVIAPNLGPIEHIPGRGEFSPVNYIRRDENGLVKAMVVRSSTGWSRGGAPCGPA